MTVKWRKRTIFAHVRLDNKTNRGLSTFGNVIDCAVSLFVANQPMAQTQSQGG